MQESNHVLLQLPVPFATFATVKVPVTKQGVTTSASGSAPADSATSHVGAHTAKLLELSNNILARQPGGPLIAYPSTAGHCQVTCHKTAVGSIYKGLKAQQTQLQIKMPDVKSSVSLSALSVPELETAFSIAVQGTLTSQGWALLENQHLLDGSLWELEAGKQHAYQSVRLSVTCCSPATVVLQAQTGLVMLKLLDPWNALPTDLTSRLGLADGLSDPGSLKATNRAVEGLPCSLLPDGRPAIVSHVSTDTADESSLRQQWLVNAGVHLPATISYIVHVRFVDDCDAPTVPYPSCCVLAPGGLSYTSHKPGTHAQLGVLRKLTEALSAPNGFWKGRAQVLLHQDTFASQPATPINDAQPQTATGWATAAQRQTQNPSSWSTKGLPDSSEGSSLFRLSDYKPAEQVLAAAPIVPDDGQMLVKRPLRPKVAVSQNLKLLLQATEQQKPAPAVRTPCKQIAANSTAAAGQAVTKQVVLKKRHQYAPSEGPRPSGAPATQGTDQTAAQLISGQPQDGGLTAAEGTKRPAIQPGVPLKPTLLKRPKLATQGKAPANKAAALLSKATASKAKPAAAKKAPTGSKATAKAPSSITVPKPHCKDGLIAVADLQAATSHASTVNAPHGVSVATPAAVPFGALGTTTPVSAAAAAAATEAAASAAPAKAPRQRKKADDMDLAEVEKKVQEKFAAGRLQDLSIAELKCFLKAHKLPVGGKKSDLVSRVEPLLAKG